jgi:hypothetical protein
MLTYQVRPRTFRIAEGASLSFPADVRIDFHFQPLQPFGSTAGGGRTAVHAVPASAFFDANTGAHSIESHQPLQPLDLTIEEPDRLSVWKGNLLRIAQRFETLETVRDTIEGIYFALPMLLAVEFADPPFVERVDGTIGATTFRWELREWRGSFRTTTQEKQETAIGLSWERLDLLSAPGRRRLLAALHYFHTACRLSRQGATAGEFLAEVVLNLAKSLEVLFPSSGDGKPRDAVRRKLAELGFSQVEIEADYIPSLALRNEIDVGHVELGLFTPSQLLSIHAYVDHAENAFRVLLDRLLEKVAAGEFEVEPYEIGLARPEAIAVVERLRKHADRYTNGLTQNARSAATAEARGDSLHDEA